MSDEALMSSPRAPISASQAGVQRQKDACIVHGPTTFHSPWATDDLSQFIILRISEEFTEVHSQSSMFKRSHWANVFAFYATARLQVVKPAKPGLIGRL